jgi:7-carboxy-7-deazaguanine synthase
VLKINEIFETIQGEGRWTGTPAVFVRLQGCDVGCPWCDTKHTWVADAADEVSVDVIVAKTDKPTPQWWHASSLDLIRQLDFSKQGRKNPHCVITGGEPCAFDLTDITGRLIREGWTVQIETSGTYEIKAHKDTWITLSPKVRMPGRRKVLDAALIRAHEIKMPVGNESDIETLVDLLGDRARMSMEVPLVYVQPLSQSKKATALCEQKARTRGWRVSYQVHKFVGLR